MALEEKLGQNDVGKAVLASLRPQFVIGQFIRCPVHGVIIAMRQVDGVRMRDYWDVEIRAYS